MSRSKSDPHVLRFARSIMQRVQLSPSTHQTAEIARASRSGRPADEIRRLHRRLASALAVEHLTCDLAQIDRLYPDEAQRLMTAMEHVVTSSVQNELPLSEHANGLMRASKQRHQQASSAEVSNLGDAPEEATNDGHNISI